MWQVEFYIGKDRFFIVDDDNGMRKTSFDGITYFKCGDLS